MLWDANGPAGKDIFFMSRGMGGQSQPACCSLPTWQLLPPKRGVGA
jgi:hypothetical protein